MIMKGIFTYDGWGMLQRFAGKLVELCNSIYFLLTSVDRNVLDCGCPVGGYECSRLGFAYMLWIIEPIRLVFV